MNEDVNRVLGSIRAAGGHPLLVGGCVRDEILGLDSKDIDIEVYGLDPIELHSALKKVSMVKEAGKSFGVYKIRSGDTDMDVSLPRTESKSGSGHRGFQVITEANLDEERASARRDFTINSMIKDPETNEIIDYHHGLEDLQSGILRHTSDAFADDPLRVLRGIQFAARFGFTMAPQTIDVCMDLKPYYLELSKERIWGEWEKIGTKGKHIAKAVDLLNWTDWIGWFPELTLVGGYDADQAAIRADLAGLKGYDRLVIVFAGLMEDLSEGLVRSFLESIGCPEGLVKRIVPLVINYRTDALDSTIRRLARKLAPSTIREFDLVYPHPHGMETAERLGVADGPEAPIITGDHLIGLGMKPGPDFKKILAEMLAAQDDGVFSDVPGGLEHLTCQLA